MDNIEWAKKRIMEVISRSHTPEDPHHAANIVQWLLKLNPEADEGLQIAALGHDIERAIEKRKIKRLDSDHYDDFKQAHALNSAVILVEILRECGISQKLINDIFHLVKRHETGYDSRADLLRDADGISFFHVNLPFYFTRNGFDETKRRFMWGYRRLPDKLKGIINEFKYPDEELMSSVREWLALCRRSE